MLHQGMRPSSAGSTPWQYASSFDRTPPGSEASARSRHTTPGTTRHAAPWEPADLRCAAGTYIARSGIGFADWAAQHFPRLSARYLLFRGQLGQQRVALHGVHERIFALARKFVIAAGRTVLPKGDLAVFPVATHQGLFFQAAQRGVDRPAGQAGYVHDVKTVNIA